jgi:hypothetical protein
LENSPSRSELPGNGDIVLADLLDRVLNTGVVLWGEATISVADIDLVYLGLRVLLASTDAAERMRKAANSTVAKF